MKTTLLCLSVVFFAASSQAGVGDALFYGYYRDYGDADAAGSGSRSGNPPQSPKESTNSTLHVRNFKLAPDALSIVQRGQPSANRANDAMAILGYLQQSGIERSSDNGEAWFYHDHSLLVRAAPGKLDKIGAALAELKDYGVQIPQAETTSLESFLEQVGEQYDVFFTLELYDVSISGWHSSQTLEPPSLPPDLKSVLVTLANSAPAFAIMTNSGNARIYHVIDKSLLETNDYAMNRILDSVVYHGNASSYIEYLHERVPPLSIRRSFSAGSADLADVMANELTKISLDETKVAIRAALSDGVDPHTCNRIVWTSLTSPDLKSTVATYHRKPVSKKGL